MRLPRSLSFWGPLAGGAVTFLLPFGLNDSQLTVYIFIGLAAVVVAGLSLLMGFAGQVSLGQAAFYAIGAYTAGIMARRGLPPVLGLAAAPLFTALVATLVGLPLLRLRGHYLAFATLAFQLIVLSVVGEARDLTGGDTGLTGIPPLSAGPVVLDPGGRYFKFEYAYLVWLLVVVVLVFNRNLVSSRPGRGLRALATSEAGALSAGIAVGGYKLRVFALSAAYAGIAGAMYAFFLSYIAPGSFPILLSIQFLVMASVGGLGVVWGSVVGAAVIYLLAQVLVTLGSQPGMPLHAPAVLNYAVYGLVLVLVMLFLPDGLLPAIQDRLARRRAARATAVAVTAES
jgi:branched-chain amino acid transport system permease protein